MNRKVSTRVLTLLMAVIMLIGIVPPSAYAASIDTFDSGTDRGMWDIYDTQTVWQAGEDQDGEVPSGESGTLEDTGAPVDGEHTGVPSSGSPVPDAFGQPEQSDSPVALGTSGNSTSPKHWLQQYQEWAMSQPGGMALFATGSPSFTPLNWGSGQVADRVTFANGAFINSPLPKISMSGDVAFCAEWNGLSPSGNYTSVVDGSDSRLKQILANYDNSGKSNADYAAAQMLIWARVMGTSVSNWGTCPGASSANAIGNGTHDTSNVKYNYLKWTGGVQDIITYNNDGTPTEPTEPTDPTKPTEPEDKIGYLEITKFDGTTNLPLGGAVFKIESESYNNDSFSVPYGGRVIPIPIPAGKDSVQVTITEITPPYQYAGDPTPKTVTVTPGDLINVQRVSFVNYPQECSLTIYKYEKGNPGIPLAGAKFRIRYADPNVSAQVWTLTTDASGRIKIDLSAAGTLIIEELEAPAGYVIGQISTWDVVVAKGEHKQVDISNDKTAQLLVYKRDKQSGQLLQGAVIKATLLRSHTPPYQQGITYTVTTDASGVALFDNLIPGEYRVEEQSPPQFYLPTDQVFTISVFDGSVEAVTLTFENEPWTGLKIVKVDATDGHGLQGAVFKLYEGSAEDPTKFLGDFISDINGVVVIQHLKSNQYYTIIESQAPYGYFVDKEHHTQTIMIRPEAIDNSTTVIFRNMPKPNLLIEKVDALTGVRLPGAVFRVAKRGSAEYVEVTTKSDGTILLENLDEGWYQVTEIRSPSGYLLDSSVHDIELVPGETAKLVVNDHKKPSLTIRKVDEATGKGLEGAVFRVTKDGAMEFEDVTTGPDGEITLRDLSPGWVTIVEQKAPNRYILDQTPHHIELQPGGDHVIVIKDQHKPSLKIIKLDSVTKQPLQYVTFKLAYKNGIPLGEFTTEENGEIYLEDIDPGLLVITEAKGRDGYVISHKEKEVLVEWGKLVTVEFLNQPINPLLIKKIDSKTGEPLAGAKFLVTKVNAEFVGEYTTGRNGYITVTGLLPGFYVAKEIKSPDGYILNDTPKTVELKLDQPAIVEFENNPLNGIQISKVDKDTGEPLEGITFVVRKKGGSVIGEFKTDKNGLIDVPDLEPGWYQVFETATLPGYLLDSNVRDVELTWNKHVLLEFTNQKYSGLQVRKLDSVTKEPIPGIKFRITKLSGEFVGDFVTGSGGFFATDAIEPNTYYSVWETATVPGYILDTTPQTFSVKKGESKVLEFENKPLSGLQIRKVDAVTGLPLAGVEFKVTELDGRLVGNFTTPESGVIFVPNLKPGYYVVQEIKGLNTHKPDTATRNILVETGKLNIVEYRNYPYPTLELQKIDGDTLLPLEGVRFRLLDRYQREIGIFKTNAQGKITLTGMDEGRFYIQEVEAKTGYVLDGTVREAILEWGKVTSIEIKNTPMSTLRIKKVDKDTKKSMPGVTFLLRDWKNNIIGEYTTDNNGYIDLPKTIAAGKYKLQELKTMDTHVLDEQPRTIELKAGETTEIVIENQRKEGRIQIKKIAVEYNDITKDKKGALLKGAIFEIFDAKNNEVVDWIETDSRGLATSKYLPLGRYGIREITPPKHYILDDKVFWAEVKLHDDLIQFEVENKPAEISVTVQKYGNYEAIPGTSIRYDFKNIANTSTVPLDSFYFHDAVPTDAVRLTSISTGTWNERLTYKVLYKTNQRDYRVLEDKLSSQTVNEIDCQRETLKLKNGEYITDIKFEFGTVQPGFKEATQPYIICTVNGNLDNEYRFTNHCDVGGEHQRAWVIAKDAWVTIVYAKPKGKLPKMGFKLVSKNFLARFCRFFESNSVITEI